MTQLLSSISFYGTEPFSYNTVVAQASTHITYGSNSKPVTISFTCFRLAAYIDRRIADVYKNAISGNAHLNMTPNRLCSHQLVTGEYGNKRKHLSECSCEALDRVSQPQIRAQYEDRVIETIFQILAQSTTSFSLKLALFASGSLLGEQILLFRLLEKLRKQNAKGTIELFFIDRCYENPIQNANPKRSFEDFFEKAPYINQFLEDLCQCLPQTIKVKGTFFKSDEDYIQRAQSDRNFKHHLIIGADPENTLPIIKNIGEKAGWGLSEPITLLTGSPGYPETHLYAPESEGLPVQCSDSQPSTVSPPQTQLAKNQNDLNPLILTAAAIGVLFFVILGLSLIKQSLYSNLELS